MLKTKLNVLALRKDPLPAVIFHEPEAIELCSTTPLMKNRTHSGCKAVTIQDSVYIKLCNLLNAIIGRISMILILNLCSLFLKVCLPFWDLEPGKVTTKGTQFLSGCTESAVIGLWEKRALTQDDVTPANAILEIRPFQVRLHHLDSRGEATVHMDTYQVARIAYCTADHNVSPNIFAWIYREINDDLTYQMDCHAVECESKLEAKKLAHAMMEAFKKTFNSMKSDGRIHKSSSSDEFPQEYAADDG
ncbi:PCLI1 protein, partial [Polypterus senegalus]|nr:PCLI1 protein [Polypterus senegalus]